MLLDSRKALSREKRRGTLSHYHGTLAALLEEFSPGESRQRVRTMSQSGPGEMIYACRVLSAITNTALVIHGGVGCSASAAWFNRGRNGPWYSSGLDERDTILGGEEKLKEAVRRAYEEVVNRGNHPELIFILGSPISAINNDDVEAVILELKSELDRGIIFIDVNGFKTKSALTGYDAVSHALLRGVVEERVEGAGPFAPFANLLTMSENPASVAAVLGLLRRLDIPVNIAPRFAGPGNIRRASWASCTLTLNDGENEYLALGLEEMGVPFVRTSPPVGSAGIRDFVMKAAAFFGREREAEVLIGEETEKAKPWIGQKPLAGKKVFAELDPSLALGFIPLVEELGGSISGLAVSSLDASGAAKLGELPSLDRNLPVLVAQGQQFEQLNVLKKYPADFYAGSSENAAAAARAGLRPLAIDNFTIHGYEGIREMVLRLRRLSQSQGSRENPGSPSFYSPLWFRRAGNWYVKLEVK